MADDTTAPVPTALAETIKNLIDAASQIGPLNYLPTHFTPTDEAALAAATDVLNRYLAARNRDV